MMLGVAGTQLIGIAAQLGIADLLKDGALPVSGLAAATGTREQPLLRAMRALCGLGLFTEPEPRRFANTAMGQLLRADSPQSLRGYALLLASNMMMRGWANLTHALQTGEGALANALGMPVYAHFQRNPEDAAVFDAAMSSVSGQEAIALRQAYDFSRFGCVVDIGGGRGLVLATLLAAYPTLRGVLLELPSVADGARTTLSSHVAAGRCHIQSGDFCTAVPAGGDIYLLKRVLVVLDDVRAKRILQLCRAVMAPASRLLIAEPDLSSLYGRLYDVFMLMAHGTGVRTVADMSELLADCGFRMLRTIGTASSLRLFEAEPL